MKHQGGHLQQIQDHVPVRTGKPTIWDVILKVRQPLGKFQHFVINMTQHDRCEHFVILTCQPFIIIHSHAPPTRKTNYLQTRISTEHHQCSVNAKCAQWPGSVVKNGLWTDCQNLPTCIFFLGWVNRLWYLLDVFDGISNWVQNLYNGDWNQTWLYWLMYTSDVSTICDSELRGWLSVCVHVCSWCHCLCWRWSRAMVLLMLSVRTSELSLSKKWLWQRA